MAQRQKKKKPKVAEAERQKPAPEPEEIAEDALARTSDAPAEDQDKAQDGAENEEEAVKAEGGEEKAADAEEQASLAAREAEEGEDDAPAATQLGTDRYVLAGFFAAGMLLSYVIGRAIQTAWQNFSNKDWFSQNLPRLAAVAD